MTGFSLTSSRSPFFRPTSFGLLSEYDDAVDVALIVALAAIPFDRVELFNQHALARVDRAPIPARHGIACLLIYLGPRELP